MWTKFRKFAFKGNVFDLAVGIILGISFTAVVNSLVRDVIMPPIGWVLGNVDFTNMFITLRTGTPPGPYDTLAAATEAGAITIGYGTFINTVVSFVIVAAVLFIIVQGIEVIDREEPKPAPPKTKVCPFCKTDIPLKAVRCPNCTSQLPAK